MLIISALCLAGLCLCQSVNQPLGPLHMSPVNLAGSFCEISPRHSFLCKNADVVANNTSLCSTILVVFLEFLLVCPVDRAEISHMNTPQNIFVPVFEPARLPDPYEKALNRHKMILLGV